MERFDPPRASTRSLRPSPPTLVDLDQNVNDRPGFRSPHNTLELSGETSAADVVHIQHGKRHRRLACQPAGWRHITEPVDSTVFGLILDRVFQPLHALR